jgi:hypothetical protein
MKLKRAWLVVALSLTLAGFSAGCGPQEKYCYDQHETCKQAVQDKKDKAQQEEEERLRRLDALGVANDGGSIVVGE